ncbi:MAG: xanthine dehydrogenase family protein molybdopterin-binding subunit, partial [Burkholderiales bacterium]
MTAQPLRFGSDHGVLRSEDAPLLTGRGRYTDDVNLPGQAYAVFVRASVGHARIQRLDTTAAKAMPGVIAILTAKELSAAGVQSIPPLATMNGRDGKPMFVAAMPALAVDRVRYVGEPVACVVAETEAQALDAAEQV